MLTAAEREARRMKDALLGIRHLDEGNLKIHFQMFPHIGIQNESIADRHWSTNTKNITKVMTKCLNIFGGRTMYTWLNCSDITGRDQKEDGHGHGCL